MVREDWVDVTLSEIIDVKHGFAFPGENIREDPPGDILLTPGNFSVGGGFKGGKYKYFDGQVPEEYVLHENDLIVTMTDLSKDAATLGYSALVPKPRDSRFLHNQRLGRIRIRDSAKADKLFVAYLLRTPDYRHEILASATGTTVKHTSPSRILAFKTSIPSLPEQRAIAHILGTLDAKIELNRRTAETLEETARALFKSWFVCFDPVRAKAKGRDPGLPRRVADLFPSRLAGSELGEIPEGWAVSRIGSLADRIVDKVNDHTEWRNERLIDLSRMPQRAMGLSDWGTGEEMTTSVTRFRPRDVLFGAIRPYFHKVGIAPISGVTNISVFVIRSKHVDDWPFVALHCSMSQTIDYAVRVSKGTKMPIVSWGDFANGPVVVPNEAIRTHFGRVVAPLLDRIIAHTLESQQVAAMRDVLLPKLVSGQLRVNGPGRATGGGVND